MKYFDPFYAIFSWYSVMTYSSTTNLVAQVIQVYQFLKILYNHQLFLKNYKCAFGVFEVEYLGHIVSGEGVHVDPMKIKVMKNWPRPKTLKILCGFIGLIG
jgi:hypothetical protein